MFSPLIQELIESLRCLPGIGPKSAQRMAFHLLERDRHNGIALAKTIEKALANIGNCQRCRTFSETDLCRLCQHQGRNQTLLCIVETPADILAIEQTGAYQGQYFVLMGHLSPIDGIGPNEIGMDMLKARLEEGQTQEVILATNPTVEGEATAHYITQNIAPPNMRCSRIAHGVPLGGELEYLDGGTLARALSARFAINL